MNDRVFTDEELSAFLDGEADFAPIAEIARALEHDEDLLARVTDLAQASQVIAACFQAMVPDQLSLPDL